MRNLIFNLVSSRQPLFSYNQEQQLGLEANGDGKPGPLTEGHHSAALAPLMALCCCGVMLVEVCHPEVGLNPQR